MDVDSDNLTPIKKTGAGYLGILNETVHETFEIDDTNRRNEDTADRLNRRNMPDSTARQHKPKWNVLLPALRPQLPQSTGFAPQAGTDAAVRNCNQHARFEQVDAPLLGVANDQATSFACQPGLECARNFMESRVDDAAVEPRSLLTRRWVLLDGRNRKPAAGELARDSAADDPRAYDAGVEHLSGKSVKIPSAPRLRNFEISAGSFTVQTWICSPASRAVSMTVGVTTSLWG